MKANLQNEKFVMLMWSSHKNRLSSLHITIKQKLNLVALGFVSEQRIGSYFVDEINEEKKVIIEVNGDYVHANPKIYSSDDMIRLRGNQYKASEKWKSDYNKIAYLTNIGYKVFTIWESDDISLIKKKISE